ncbi:MAG: hypothetical protein JWM59_558 [Verrucomicrobiales bacterium]|nr:hypothetical protein [Verrucomicrobiales bacterium]
MSAQIFEEMDVWKRGCRQGVTVCRLIQDWRNFALRDQITRAAVSVRSNVAEGYERDSDGDFRRFLRIAKGSNAELRTQLYIASSLGLIDETARKTLINESKEISAMLQGFIRAIERRSIPLNPET